MEEKDIKISKNKLMKIMEKLGNFREAVDSLMEELEILMDEKQKRFTGVVPVGVPKDVKYKLFKTLIKIEGKQVYLLEDVDGDYEFIIKIGEKFVGKRNPRKENIYVRAYTGFRKTQPFYLDSNGYER